MAIWSEVPPRMLMSVCMPIGPLWRTSTPAICLRRSFTVFAGIEAMATLSITVTILALAPKDIAVREAWTETDSSVLTESASV